MRKILVVLGICLMIPSIGYTENLWEQGDGYHFIENKKIGKNSDLLITVDYCIKKRDYCETFINLRVECGGEEKSNWIMLKGNPKLQNNVLSFKGKDGSKFNLSSIKRTQKDIDYGGLTVILNSDFNGNFNSKWNTNQCKKEVEYVTKNINSLLTNIQLESFLGD